MPKSRRLIWIIFVGHSHKKRGVDIRTAQYLMGHADIQMTANIYTHVDFEIINQAAALM